MKALWYPSTSFRVDICSIIEGILYKNKNTKKEYNEKASKTNCLHRAWNYITTSDNYGEKRPVFAPQKLEINNIGAPDRSYLADGQERRLAHPAKNSYI